MKNELGKGKFKTRFAFFFLHYHAYSKPLRPVQDGFYKVRAEIKYASGKAYFDNLRFSNGEELTEYKYDQNGNYVTYLVMNSGI